MLRVSLAIQAFPLETGTSITGVSAAIEVTLGTSVAYDMDPLETIMAGGCARELANIALRSHSGTLEPSVRSVQNNIRLLHSIDGLLDMNEQAAPFQIPPK